MSHSIEDTATRTTLSVGTVKTHLISIRGKLDVPHSNRAAAIYAAARRTLPEEDRYLLEPLSNRATDTLRVVAHSKNPESFQNKMRNKRKDARQEINTLYRELGARSMTEVLVKGVRFGHINLDQKVKQVSQKNLCLLTERERGLMNRLIANRGRNDPKEIERNLGYKREDITSTLDEIREKLTNGETIKNDVNPILRYLAMIPTQDRNRAIRIGME